MSDVLTLHKFLLLTFLGAQKKIYITSPYFLLDAALGNVIRQKARAGVDVRIVVPNELTDTPGVRYAGRFAYQDLLDAGVRIYEYQPVFIHAKYLVIDSAWSIIGSANMDNRSRMLNEESILGIADKDFGEKIEAMFMDDVSNTKEINKDEWPKRGIGQRIREIFARKFVKQY